jgi:transcriptional regulator with XRE-family HTH domain
MKKSKKQPVYETERFPFPQKLKRLMDNRKISQETLAKALGVTRQAISLYTQGQSVPDLYKLQNIAKFFDVDISYLVDEEKVKPLFEYRQFEKYCKNHYGDELLEVATKWDYLSSDGKVKMIERIDELLLMEKYRNKVRLRKWENKQL